MPLNLTCGETNWGTWSVVPHIHIHFWLKTIIEPVSFQTLVQKVPYEAASNGWNLRYAQDITSLWFQIFTNDEFTLNVVAGWNPTLGKWYCIDATFDGRFGDLYVDNVLLGTDSFVGPHVLAPAATNVLLSAADNYPGHVEGLAIWTEPLDPAHRALLYHGGRRIALAETRLLSSPAGTLEAMLELTDDSLDYSANARDLDLAASLTYDCGQPFTRRLGGGGGAYGPAYCPPLMAAHKAQRVCTHQDLAETSGR